VAGHAIVRATDRSLLAWCRFVFAGAIITRSRPALPSAQLRVGLGLMAGGLVVAASIVVLPVDLRWLLGSCAACTIGLGVLLVQGSRYLSVHQVQVAVCEAGIERVGLLAGRAQLRVWSWADVAAVDLVEVVSAADPTRSLNPRRHIQVVIASGETFSISLEWPWADRVAPSLLARRFIPDGRLPLDAAATRRELAD
jgi:hypothetical protein